MKYHIITYKRIARGAPRDDVKVLEDLCRRLNKNEREKGIVYRVEPIDDQKETYEVEHEHITTKHGGYHSPMGLKKVKQ